MSDSIIRQSSEIGHNIVAAPNSNVNIGNIQIDINSSEIIDWDYFIQDIYILIISNKLEEAKCILDLNKSCGLQKLFTGKKQKILEILEYKISLVKGETVNINNDLFTGLLKDQQLSFLLRNLVKSVEIHYKFSISKNNAKEIYLKSEFKNGFTRAVYFEFLASEKELNEFVKSEDINELLEYEHYALIQCALHNQKFELANVFAKSFKEKYHGNNSEIILNLTQTINLLYETKLLHYWIIDKKQWHKLQELISKCIPLFNKTKDSRVLRMAAFLFALKRCEDNQLEVLAKKNPEEFKKYFSDLNLELLDKTSDNVFINQDWLNTKKTLNEFEFNQLCNEVYSSKISNIEVVNWINKGGKLSIPEGKKYIYEFQTILLKLISYSQVFSLEEKYKLFSHLDKLLESYLKYYGDLCIITINLFVDLLIELGFEKYANMFLKPLIPENPWLSPIVFRYLIGLLYDAKLKTFDKYLSQLEENNYDYEILYLKVLKSYKLESYPEIKKNVEFALEKFPHSIAFWNIYLETLAHIKLDFKEIESIISTIPESLYSNFNTDSLNLVYKIANLNLPFAKSIFLEWFIDNPSDLYIPITNFVTDYIFQLESETYPSPRCSIAIIYKINNKTCTKLLVDDCVEHEYLLSTKLDIASQLINTDIGQAFDHKYNTYKIVDKINPFSAALAISFDVRKTLQLDHDHIHIIDVQDSPDGFEKFLNYIKSTNVKTVNQEFDPYFNSLNINLKHKILNKNIVWNAYDLLCNKEVNKHLIFYDKNINTLKEIVVDILFVVYLAITGFCHGLVRTGVKIFVTKETQSILQCWITNNTIESIDIFNKEKKNLIENINFILKSSKLLLPNIIDMPDDLSELRHFVDNSHYSSVEVSFSNSVPLVCLDTFLCPYYERLNINLVNVESLLFESYKKTLYYERHHTGYLAKYNLNTLFSIYDIFDLCTRTSETQEYAAIIINKYYNLVGSVNMLQFLVKCCIRSIEYVFQCFSVNLYTDNIIYACCRIAINELKNKTCEERIANLIFWVISELSPPARQFALNRFVSFICGHFLDIITVMQCIQKIVDDQSQNIVS
ncbi:PIN domain-containing protein [Snodgrassella communis]|uniref:PIN domain-containing protein n=2 Tax=Snodgrassella TaxID=1193515 RepID=UPI00286AB888|nr:hypothetical protein [Snodgrassella communis]WMY92601.1 hypothetical protein PYG29_04385 [Snodgrassella communis]